MLKVSGPWLPQYVAQTSWDAHDPVGPQDNGEWATTGLAEFQRRAMSNREGSRTNLDVMRYRKLDALRALPAVDSYP
jgi:hypothetical protein